MRDWLRHKASAAALVTTTLLSGGAQAPEAKPPVDKDGRPLIRKRGTIELARFADTSLIIFRGRLYSLRWSGTMEDHYSHFVDYETGKSTPPFARGHGYTQAFVEDDAVYVTATGGVREEEMDKVYLFVSKDLMNWDSSLILDLPGWVIFTTPVCKAGNRHVMMLDV